MCITSTTLDEIALPSPRFLATAGLCEDSIANGKTQVRDSS